MRSSSSSSTFLRNPGAFSLRNVRWTEVDWHILLIALVLLGLGLLFLDAMAGSVSIQT